MNDEPLAKGNAAKLYCLQYIDRLAEARRGALSVLDLGCGAGLNFVTLLRKHPAVHYTGVDPSPEAIAAARRNLRGLDAEVHTGFAYDLRLGPADVVVSFSVLEHVYRRRAYLECARRNLAPDGAFLINYDAGHFVNPGPLRPGTDRWHNLFSPIQAALGRQRSYQSFVREESFRSLIAAVGFRVIDEKVFNTGLKEVYKAVPAGQQGAFMARWLELELELNAMDIRYSDALAGVFRTRNFVLTHAEGA